MIPDWFNIDRYISVAEYDNSQWYFELYMRTRLYPLPLDINSSSGLSLLGIGDSRDDGDPYVRRARELDLKLAKSMPDVCNLQYGEPLFTGPVWETLRNTPNNCLTKRQGPVRLVENVDEASSLINHSTLHQPLLSVDLGATNKKLIEKFKAALPRLRERQRLRVSGLLHFSQSATINEISKAKLAQLYSCGLLPYLDLHQWSVLTGSKITQSEYGNTIFSGMYPRHEDPARTINDTTFGKYARNVFHLRKLLEMQIEKRWYHELDYEFAWKTGGEDVLNTCTDKS